MGRKRWVLLGEEKPIKTSVPQDDVSTTKAMSL